MSSFGESLGKSALQGRLYPADNLLLLEPRDRVLVHRLRARLRPAELSLGLDGSETRPYTGGGTKKNAGPISRLLCDGPRLTDYYCIHVSQRRNTNDLC